LTRTKIPARSGHQLQVIYHDEANIMLAFQAPAFGAQFHDAKTGRIVYKNISSKKTSGRIDQSLKFVIIKLTGSCRLCIDASFHRQQPLYKRLIGHFKAEDGYFGLEFGILM